jgi:uncharacterized membrane protein
MQTTNVVSNSACAAIFTATDEVRTTQLTTGVILVCIKLGGAVISLLIDMEELPKLRHSLVTAILIFHKLELCRFFFKGSDLGTGN